MNSEAPKSKTLPAAIPPNAFRSMVADGKFTLDYIKAGLKRMEILKKKKKKVHCVLLFVLKH